MMMRSVVVAAVLVAAGGPAQADGFTLKAKDVPPVKLNGAPGEVRVLIDGKNAKSDKASMVLVELQAGGHFVRPSSKGKAYIYMKRGRVSIGEEAADMSDVIILEDGAAPSIDASARTEMVIVFSPPGAEQALRDGRELPPPTPGAPAKIVRESAVKPIDFLDGKATAWVYNERDAVSVLHLRIPEGTLVSEHSHGGSAELLFIIDGGGDVVIGGQKLVVDPTSAVYVPPGAKHSMIGVGARLNAIQFFTPSGPELSFKGKGN